MRVKAKHKSKDDGAICDQDKYAQDSSKDSGKKSKGHGTEGQDVRGGGYDWMWSLLEGNISRPGRQHANKRAEYDEDTCAGFSC